MNQDNGFVRTFGHGSEMMRILFDLLLIRTEDSNNSDEILDVVMSCKIMYETCNHFFSTRRIR
jgi:hypothetical protein